MRDIPDFDADNVSRMFIDLKAGALRPAWTSMLLAGLVPSFLDVTDEDDAIAQIAKNYIGWHDAMWMEPEVMNAGDVGEATMLFKNVEPGDPPLREVTRCMLREETIIMFQYAWTVVVSGEGQLVGCARLD